MSKYKIFFKKYINYLNKNEVQLDYRIKRYIKVINTIKFFIDEMEFEKIYSDNTNKSKNIEKYKIIFKNISKYKILLYINLLYFYNTYSVSNKKYKSVKDYNFYCFYFKKKYGKDFKIYNLLIF